MGKHGDGRDPRTHSPFRPGAGTVPPALVGRDADLEAIEDAIAQVAGGEPPQVALFVGERGMGKTVLLRRCEQMAREAGGIVLRGEMAPHADLQRAFAPGVQRAQEDLNGAPQRIEHRRPFLEALHDLNNAAHKHGRFLVISIDEIHSAEPDELRQLAAYIQLTHEPNNPLLVFGAGLPETRDFIKEHLPTYARQRWTYHEIGELSIEETRAAITVPLRDRDVAIASDALDELVSISGQYPYFIQGFAAAAWKQHFASTGWQYRVGDTITHEDVKASIPRAERQLHIDARISQAAIRVVSKIIGPGEIPDGLTDLVAEYLQEGLIRLNAQAAAEHLPLTEEVARRLLSTSPPAEPIDLWMEIAETLMEIAETLAARERDRSPAKSSG
uniref:AAA+ ATPase domain-containing protein n=1 Tax=mine drainage metagenome TaxID=410659 RepID=E6Q2R4_9ZZZZ